MTLRDRAAYAISLFILLWAAAGILFLGWLWRCAPIIIAVLLVYFLLLHGRH